MSYELSAICSIFSCRRKPFCDRSGCQTVKNKTIIWDFDGTLLPLAPYDSEQTLLLYKLNEGGEKLPFFIRALALALLYADQKEYLRKVFKRFYIRFMTGAAMDILNMPIKIIVLYDLWPKF